MPSKSGSNAAAKTALDSSPRLIGVAMLVTIALLWQLHGCTTPIHERQMANQPADSDTILGTYEDGVTRRQFHGRPAP